MQGNLSHFAHTRSNSLSLGNNHGYRFEGDIAILNAELALHSVAPLGDDSEDSEDNGRQHWALQLWACESPHQGGPLRGLKIAEAELALPSLVNEGQREATRLETAAFAQLPPRHGEYAMVMVLASGDQGRYDQVHDFSNYAVRQQFSGPSLEGNVGYRFEGESVVLQAEAVRNARAVDNLSGTLGLQLWALHEPYQGGQVHGTLLAQAGLGRLSGQQELHDIEERVSLAELAPGEWQLALLLSEWTDAAGFVTRDYCNFSAPHRVEAQARAAQTAVSEPVVLESAVSERVEAQAPAPAPKSPAPPVDVQRTIEVSSSAAEPAVSRAVPAPSEAKIALKSLSAAPTPRPAAGAAHADKAPSAKPLTTQAPRAETAATQLEAEAPAKAKPSATSSTGRLSVQTASVDELASVPGLNKKLAQAIVKARPFNTLEDLVRVRGIGDKLLQKLRDKLSL